MSQPSKQPVSGLAKLKRDFSSNAPIKPTVALATSNAPVKRSTISDALRRAIEEGVASREADAKPAASLYPTPLSQKRSLPSQPTDAPPAKRRLPDSWNDTSSSSSTYNYTSSARSLSSTPYDGGSSLSTESKSERKPLVVPAKTLKAVAKPAALFLSAEQKQILQLVKEGKSVFYTGSAGTGKSVLLRNIITTLQKSYARVSDAVAVTASTGIAACNIGGVTIHSFAGIGLGIESAEILASKIQKNRKASARWLRTKVLIIDEISMIDGDLFDKLAQIGCILRKRTQPFGGIQVVVTGDFFQLPPVTKGNKPMKFAFEAQRWKETIQRSIKLTKVFRQKDQEFVDMLNEMRYGTLSPRSIAKFKSLSREIIYEDGLGPTELFPRRQDVDSSNILRMSRLQGEVRTFLAKDGGTAGDDQRKKLLDNLMAPEKLEVTVGSQVMLIKNIDETLVNGSMGVVQRFSDPTKYAAESEDPEFTVVEKPSSSVGKKNTSKSPPQLMPVVDFSVPGGGKRTVLVMPESWKIELPNGEIQASRQQLPLILAWAMSIHKSQGQTLDRVKVDLAKVFEKGQAYVALSRATTLDGLQVLNFSADKVFVHEKVKQWSKTLEELDVGEHNIDEDEG